MIGRQVKFHEFVDSINKVKATFGHCIVAKKKDPEEKKLESGLYIPSTVNDKPKPSSNILGLVISVGEGQYSCEDRAFVKDPKLEEGAYVLFNPSMGFKLDMNDETFEYYLVNMEKIVAFVEKDIVDEENFKIK